MNRLILTTAFLGLIGSPVLAKQKEPVAAAPAKDSAKDKDTSTTIKDTEALKCIQARLEEQTGSKGWKIALGDLAGTARAFTASNGGRNEQGTVNVAKDYPNGGALRVYVQPRD
jgi:hypothetical protein